MYFMAEAALMLKGLSASSHQGVIALFGKHFVQIGYLSQPWGAPCEGPMICAWPGITRVGYR
jgi:hypothetical protein